MINNESFSLCLNFDLLNFAVCVHIVFNGETKQIGVRIQKRSYHYLSLRNFFVLHRVCNQRILEVSIFAHFWVRIVYLTPKLSRLELKVKTQTRSYYYLSLRNFFVLHQVCNQRILEFNIFTHFRALKFFARNITFFHFVLFRCI